MSELHAHFHPLRPPSGAGRKILLLAGPLLWLAALVAWSVVSRRTDFILYAFVIAGGSFLVGSVTHLTARARRLREEREPAPGR
jgi:hypothetical protein